VHDRHDLTDAEWDRLEPLLPDRAPARGGRWSDHRQLINGVFWRTRTGAPWRDLPTSYGNWKTVYSRHRRWSGDGTWAKILDRLRAGCDMNEGSEWTVGADSSTVRAHQHAAGARCEPPKDIPQDKLTPLLAAPRPAAAQTAPADTAGDTGGWVESQKFSACEAPAG